MPEQPNPLRLACGVVLSLSQHEAHLIDLKTKEKHALTIQDLPQLERLMLGHAPSTMSQRLEELKAQGILEDGLPEPDPFIDDSLVRLDTLFSAEYFDGLPDRAKLAYTRTHRAHAMRKRFHDGFGQCPILPETALRRALLIGDAAEVGALDILCIGDDDLVSVPLASLGHRVTVFDIDDYLLELLTTIQQSEGLAITACEHDLRDPIAMQEREQFDVFLTDPMANQACFKLFMSRAIPMLRPNGRGFVAVQGAAQAIFESVCAEMKMPIRTWRRRHNRYYSHFLKLHDYESDWVEVVKSDQTQPCFAADEPVNLVDLYHEDYFHRRPILLMLLDDLDETRFAKPLYLDMLMDGLLQAVGSEELARHQCYRDGWSNITAAHATGHVTLHANRQLSQVYLSAYPSDTQLVSSIQSFLISGYKTRARELRTIKDRHTFDLRIL